MKSGVHLQGATSVGACPGESVGQDLLQVDIVGTGHRVVLHRVTLVGLSKSHAMATFVGYDTPVRCGTGSYTIFMDATRFKPTSTGYRLIREADGTLLEKV